ncbi:glycosyltransferase [Microbacterium invictum]|nr:MULTISPECIES: glycosyltransferase family 2 protein [Microbacterium]
MVSVIIAAHNEESVLGATLDALLAQPGVEAASVVVSANGCRDRTAEVAAERGVTVIDRIEPGKAGALNAADDVAQDYPRIYLDADITVPPGAISRLVAHFDETSRPLAVVPRRRIDTSASSWPVKAYFAINERLPVFRTGLFGRGLIVLSEDGRARFGAFPAMIADDLYVDSQFSEAERVEAADVEIVVDAPLTTTNLIDRLVRVRRGNAQMRAAAADGAIEATVRRSDKWSWLRDVVLPDPRLAFAAVPYVFITLKASQRGRRATNGLDWGQDRSTRDTPSANMERPAS